MLHAYYKKNKIKANFEVAIKTLYNTVASTTAIKTLRN
jgi:hypothetical protein